MVRLSEIVGTLTSAWIVTGDDRYAAHARDHLAAWFVNEATRMNPSLLYGQAIKGKVTGRSIGIIDTIHLVEVARGAKILGERAALPHGFSIGDVCGPVEAPRSGRERGRPVGARVVPRSGRSHGAVAGRRPR